MAMVQLLKSSDSAPLGYHFSIPSFLVPHLLFRILLKVVHGDIYFALTASFFHLISDIVK